jgi:putative ABC transport system ATP-binding protein
MAAPGPSRDKSPRVSAADAAEADAVIGISGVNYAYGTGKARKQVLFDNELRLAAGEFVVLTGPSGSGKTTLLSLIGALRALQEGSIEVMGRELAGLAPRRMEAIRKDIGFIFQDHNLFEALTAYETLRLTMRLCRERYSRGDFKERPMALIETLDIAEQAHDKPGVMSTGQKQRVAIARALINNPKLILADEPTAALDKNRADHVIALLKERVGNEKATIFMVTHDPRIFELADRVVEMVDGRITRDR